MSAIISALAGMTAAQQKLDQAASRIAQWPGASPTDTVQLSDEAVALIEARNENAANVSVARTAGEMDRATLSLIG